MLSELHDDDAVKRAMAEFDEIGRDAFLRKYGFRSSRAYLIEYKGKNYDSKPILGAAFGYAFPQRGAMGPSDFKGGEAAAERKLRELGFVVTHISHANPPNRYLLKLNADEIPSSNSSSAWESKEFKIEPVRLTRQGEKIVPTPPDLAPGAMVAVWVNDDSKFGGIVATAAIAQVTRVGTRCRLENVMLWERFGLNELEGTESEQMQALYQDIDTNRRSKVRLVSEVQWDELDSLIRGYRKDEVVGPHATFVAHMALRLNQEACDFRIGDLQAIRSRIRGTRKSGTNIFSAKSVKSDYAFHSGGRDELQFNIGEEGDRFRWGVGFSFEPSRSFPDPEVLARNVRFFNDYISMYADDLADMLMWKYDGETGPTDIGAPQSIDPDLVRKGVFVFLGKRDSSGGIDPSTVLRDFDRLLPLYEYVESRARIAPDSAQKAPFVFKPGHRKKARKATASIAARELEMDLRHEAIQESLNAMLEQEHGRGNVGTEQVCSCGTRIDAVVKRDMGFWIYEIKTSSSPRMCLREAVGQLLEYCLWPGGISAERLIVVGETPLDAEAKTYLDLLNTKLSIPLDYLSVCVAE